MTRRVCGLVILALLSPLRPASAQGFVSGPLISGPQPFVTILCRYGDLTGTTPFPLSYYQSFLSGSGFPTMDDYWRENSNNTINLTGSAVVGWFNLPQPKSYYVYDANGDGKKDADTERMATDCTAAADASINFNDFVGFNLIFNDTISDVFAGIGSGWVGTRDGTTRLWRATWVRLGSSPQIFTHEMGHSFEFLHSSAGNFWDAMSTTHGPPLPQYGSQGGQHTIAYNKDLHGWIPASRIYNAPPASSATITLDRSELPPDGTNYLMAKIPIGRSYQHFYTIEVRRKVGYDSNLPGEGVILFDVLKGRVEPAHVVDGDNNGDPNDAGAIWNAGETFTDAANGVQITVVSETATSATVTITDLPPDATVTVEQRPFTTLAGTAGVTGTADGSGPGAQFDSPRGIAVDAAGNLYVADSRNRSIRKVAPSGVVTTFAGVTALSNVPCFPGGAPDFQAKDGTGADARFCAPAGIAIDAAGVLYVTDQCAIRRITPAAVVTTLAGSVTCGSADDVGAAASFNFPTGIAVDDAGVLYVADTSNHTIRKILPGGAVSTFAGTADVAGSVDGAGTAARFNWPVAVAVDSTGRVYVGDQNSGTIRAVTPAGVVTTLAGSANQRIPVDGPAGTARFLRPQAIAIESSSGVLYVTDAALVRQVTPSGTVTTIAGLNTGSADGVGTAARFYVPDGIAVAAGGTLYVADTGNSTIRVGLDLRLTANPALLRFVAAKAGAAGEILSVTPAQNVTIDTGGSGVTPAWTVTADQPWVQVTNGAATGTGTFNVSIVNPANVIGGATTLVSTITLTSSNTTLSTAVAVVLSVQQPGATVGAYGIIDTPANNATGLVGSIPVTGWALDDVGIQQVQIWRNCVEAIDRPVGACASAAPGGVSNFVFIANAAFLSGARPDVETLNPTTPVAYRAGWGYLMATNALPHLTNGTAQGGQGTFTLLAYAVDVENHFTLLGTKTITLDNDHATIPFGAIDTPDQGGTVATAIYANFGWAMTQLGKCIDTASTASYRVYIDGVVRPITPGVNWFPGLNRSDIAAAYPGYCNSTNALAAYYIDLDALGLANGLHTIGWDVIDSGGNVAGIGSRFFIVAR